MIYYFKFNLLKIFKKWVSTFTHITPVSPLKEVDKLAKETLRKNIDELLTPLREAWEKLQTNDYWRKIYNERYFAFVEKLRPLIARNYDFKIYPYTEKILDLPELEEKLNEEVNMAYEEYDMYYRKVNYLFAYFENKGKLYDECYAFVDRDDIEDIIRRCEEILEAKNEGDNLDEGETPEDLAESLLPTTSGFFFGSTEYDDWYFHDVKDCLNQCKKYLKLLKDGVTGYVIFSW